MSDLNFNLNTVTGRINSNIFKLLNDNPEGMRWVDLAKELKALDETFHPKTINGCIWKLTQNYPDKVYKPEKGLFKLIK
jgi:hypothetical protein